MVELERKKLWGTLNGALWKEVDFTQGKVLITEKITNEQEKPLVSKHIHLFNPFIQETVTKNLVVLGLGDDTNLQI